MKLKNFIPVNKPKVFKFEKKFILNCLKSGWISSEGNYVKLFEKLFSKFVNRKYGIAVSNGTAALEIAIKSLNLKKNSEVLIPTFSIISTANAVIKNNLKPVLLDCDLNTWNVSASEIINKITKKTKAIVITHIYGLPVDLDKILKIAKQKNIKIIEDAAEVIGLKYKNKMCGSFGDLSIFSFYANKHITTGEGGMICTSNKKLLNKCKSLRNLSFSNSYFDRFNHTDISWNYRMTNLQAAFGCGQLKNINWVVKRKREIGKKYFDKLKKIKNIILQPYKVSYAKNIYWVFGIVLSKQIKIDRDVLMKKLLRYGIETRPFFKPMNQQKIFKKYKIYNVTRYPNANFLSKNGFYLPSGLALKNSEINYILKKLLKLLK